CGEKSRRACSPRSPPRPRSRPPPLPSRNRPATTTKPKKTTEPPPPEAPGYMRICFVAAEVAPLAKTGGLADVAGALPRHLHARGHDIRVFMPLYSSIGLPALGASHVDAAQDVQLDLGAHRYRFS